MSDTERDRMLAAVMWHWDDDLERLVDDLIAAGFGDVTARDVQWEQSTRALVIEQHADVQDLRFDRDTARAGWVATTAERDALAVVCNVLADEVAAFDAVTAEAQRLRLTNDALAAQVAAARAVSWHHFGDTEYAAGMEVAREQIIEAMDRAPLAPATPAAEDGGQQ